jgi:hypothetical protein
MRLSGYIFSRKLSYANSTKIGSYNLRLDRGYEKKAKFGDKQVMYPGFHMLCLGCIVVPKST